MEENNELFLPNWVSPPGDTLKDLMKEREIGVNEMAFRTSIPPKIIYELFTGEAKINDEIADQLAKFFGVTRYFWINREFKYRQDLKRLSSTPA